MILKLMIFLGFTSVAYGQVITTPEAAVRAALQNNPLIKAATFTVKAKKHGEKAAVNLPNPEVMSESPTGEFYAVGLSQSFEFPTVYLRKKQVAKAETSLQQANKRVSENDLSYNVRVQYLDAQVAAYQSLAWAERDSLYQGISSTASRQFSAGEIDFLQKTLAENEAGKVHQEWLGATQMAALERQQLTIFTGLNDLGILLPFEPDTLRLLAPPDISGNPSIVYEQKAVGVATQQIALAKSRALPNFTLGYLNQGARNTPFDYRFSASIGIPLWIGQYRAGLHVARAESQATVARGEAQNQALVIEMTRAQKEASTALTKLMYYEREALPRSKALTDAAMRMREAGQIDYITFLRILDEAFEIRWGHSEAMVALNKAQLRLRYLAGTL